MIVIKTIIMVIVVIIIIIIILFLIEELRGSVTKVNFEKQRFEIRHKRAMS